MDLQLIRAKYPAGVNGVLLFDGEEVCKTIELPWIQNKPRISCIPAGRYQVRKRCSAKFNWHFEIMGVQGRTNILIHPANHAAAELKGCLAPVMRHNGEGKGSSSRIALERLKDRLYPLLDKGYIIHLTIK